MQVEDETSVVASRLETLLEDAGQACVGLDGSQTVQLLAGLAAQLEATLMHSIPREHLTEVMAYLAAARSTAYPSPMMTLEAIQTATA